MNNTCSLTLVRPVKAYVMASPARIAVRAPPAFYTLTLLHSTPMLWLSTPTVYVVLLRSPAVFGPLRCSPVRCRGAFNVVSLLAYYVGRMWRYSAHRQRPKLLTFPRSPSLRDSASSHLLDYSRLTGLSGLEHRASTSFLLGAAVGLVQGRVIFNTSPLDFRRLPIGSLCLLAPLALLPRSSR